jgi:hypothetical protein
MSDNLKKSQLRASRYQHVDGTFEIFFGGICLLWAIFFLLQSKLTMSEGTLRFVIVMAGFMAVSGGGAFLLDRLVKAIKERLTYSRSGYLVYRKLSGTKRTGRLLLMAGVAAVISALFTAFFASHPTSVNWMPLASGALFAFAMFIVAWRTQLPRYYLIAVLSALVGLGVSVLGLAELPGMALFYSSIGILLLGMGGIVLWKYLRQNPVTKAGEQ